MTQGQVGRYALVKRIGRGGMADVWVGKAFGASGFEKIVAVKLLTPDQVDREEFQRAITDEARLQVSLKHPNIVDVYDLNFEAENPYLVMEYVEGVELRKLLQIFHQRGITLPLSIAAYIIMEVSKALSHAHERRHPQTGEPLHIVHRDISPSNILVSVHGDVKLSDFGIAKSSLQSGKTQAGQIKGKFRYMSPEQAAGGELDYRSDIFSLGLVFYEGLTGVPAYEGDTDIQVLEKARTADVHFPSGLDPEIRKILSKFLAKRSQDRYTELQTFRRELSEFLVKKREACDRESFGNYLEGLGLPELKELTMARQEAEKWKPLPDSQVIDRTGRVSVIRTMAFQPSRRRFIIGGIGLALLIIMGGGGLGIFRRSPALPISVPLQRPAKSASILSPPKNREESIKVPPKKIQDLRVVFNAAPYATVSIPGQFSGLETPSAIQKLPPGEYEVTFFHPASGQQVSAHLKGSEGGSFVCFANMTPEGPSESPSASCRVR